MNTQDIQVLYAYNRWANAGALGAAAGLLAEQLDRDQAASHRSVFGTLVHILWGEWRWLGRWLAPAPAPGGDPLACDGLRALQARWAAVEKSQVEFLSGVTDATLSRPISYENPPGRVGTYPLGQMLQHVVNHSTYQRRPGDYAAAPARRRDARDGLHGPHRRAGGCWRGRPMKPSTAPEGHRRPLPYSRRHWPSSRAPTRYRGCGE